MIPKSVHQAAQRLHSAQDALAAFDAADTASDVEAARRHWWSFLVGVSGAYSKLEQGAKCCGRCTAWFGRVKHLRRTDPLLSYLHHARDSDTHGLADVTASVPQGFSIKTSGAFGMGESGIDFKFKNQDDAEPRAVKIKVNDGQGPERDVISRVLQQSIDHRLRLVRVTDDRFSDSFNPPTKHLQMDLDDTSPGAVGNLAVAYMRKLMEEAESMPCDAQGAPP